MVTEDPVLLDRDSVGEYLLSRGVGRPPYTDAETLAGGVSNVVVRVRTEGRLLVVKQSLETLAVADPWTAPTSRAITEAKVMELLRSVTPGRLPRIIDHDEAHHALVMQSAPERWTDWKSELLAGRVDQDVATTLGETLTTWHERTSPPTRLLEPGFDEYEAFEALRVDPYFRTAAARAPDLAPALTSVVRDMAARRSCLVHGDFSPKNVLVDPDAPSRERSRGATPALWVIDFEVAHVGDPAFDVAFMCTHLLMKSYARPALADELDSARRAFVDAYVEAATPGGPGSEPDWPHVSRLIGALLVARVIGKSPAGYLDERARRQVWQLGGSLLREPAGAGDEVTRRRDEHAG